MDINLQIIRGPSVQKVASREDAEAQLRSHPEFPKEASVTLDQIGGNWVAALAIPAEMIKEAGPPFGGPPTDDAPAPDGPPTDGPPSDEGDAPKEESSDDDKPKEDKKEPKSEDHMLTQVLDMLTKITDALGLSDPSSMMPGMDQGPAPDGPPAPPGGDKTGPDGKQHIVHDRSLKPGEAPPGTTPVGAPSFASVQVPENHPWSNDIRQGAKEIHLEDVMGDDSMSVIASELRGLAEPVGYKIEQLVPFERGGVKHVHAKVVKV